MAYPPFHPTDGYMTENVRRKFIDYSVREGLMPNVAPRMPDVVSLIAPKDTEKPIHFWQLFSIIGERSVLALCTNFYSKVWNDSKNSWFKEVFERTGKKQHHIATQSQMWLDCFGRGPTYHGGEYRLNFHHSHNAMDILDARGAFQWIEYMTETLNEACDPKNPGAILVNHFQGDLTQVARVRRSINTFLGYFMDDYAEKFNFQSYHDGEEKDPETGKRIPFFGERNPPIGQNGKVTTTATTQQQQNESSSSTTNINLLNLSEDEIRKLSVSELKTALVRHKVNITDCLEKKDLVEKALNLVM